jgi:hypothetical protein
MKPGIGCWPLCVAALALACGTPTETEQDFTFETSQDALLSTSPGNKWALGSNGRVTIPYEIENTGGYSATKFDATRTAIVRGMQHWETYVRRPDGTQLIQFVPHAGQSRWLKFKVQYHGGFCEAYLYGTGMSSIAADPSCRWQTFVHEIGHIFTFRHEQKRADRDNYVTFYAGRTTYDDQFTKVSGNYLGTTYDSNSIMHYSSCTFAGSGCNSTTPNLWVLERKTGNAYIKWGSERAVGDVLSPKDVCGFKTLYGVSCTSGSTGAGGSGGGTGTGGSGGGGGSSTVVDAGRTDAGVSVDAGTKVDAGTPLFPVMLSAAGTLQSAATGTRLCAAPNGSSIALAPCDSSAGQRWEVPSTGAFRNPGSSSCAQPATEEAGASVEARACVFAPEQQWRIADVELVNGKSGACVAVPGGNYEAGPTLVVRACSGAPEERFTFVPDTHELKAHGWCLTSASSGAVQLAECDGSGAQVWIESGGGFANGVSAASCLSIGTNSTLTTSACGAGVAQMWGLRGQLAHSNDDYCMEAAGTVLKLGLCADATPAQTFTWWPRATCAAMSCGALGASCGSFDDSCGGGVDCGSCAGVPAPPVPSVDTETEVCEPKVCSQLAACGVHDDGCGGTVDCGACTPATGTPLGCSTTGSGAALWILALALRRGVRRAVKVR